MTKAEALEILGGGGYGATNRAAARLKYRHSAISKWPDELPDRIAERVIGCAVLNGLPIPDKYLPQQASE